jgi:hypothetical protein
MKRFYLFLLSILFASSCAEDESRTISTDLSLEANQHFQFSRAFSESNYLGNISYQDYFRVASSELPGCPTIERSLQSRIITLTYSSSTECTQENTNQRSGKIILDFTLSNSASPSWTMTYEDYSIDGIKISGLRQFKALASNETEASFENLEVILPKNLSFLVKGKLNHSISRVSLRPFALSTRGSLEGRNPSGRTFGLVITEPKEQIFACYRSGWHLTQSGKESLKISRGNNSEATYSYSYQTSTGCNPSVIALLPDGRNLKVNP